MTIEAPPIVIQPEKPKTPPPLISPVFIPEQIQVQHEDLDKTEDEQPSGDFNERMQEYQDWAKERKASKDFRARAGKPLKYGNSKTGSRKEGFKLGLWILLGCFFICCVIPNCN